MSLSRARINLLPLCGISNLEQEQVCFGEVSADKEGDFFNISSCLPFLPSALPLKRCRLKHLHFCIIRRPLLNKKRPRTPPTLPPSPLARARKPSAMSRREKDALRSLAECPVCSLIHHDSHVYACREGTGQARRQNKVSVQCNVMMDWIGPQTKEFVVLPRIRTKVKWDLVVSYILFMSIEYF